jgi:DNA-binding beta-propeller fold protein YncE
MAGLAVSRPNFQLPAFTGVYAPDGTFKRLAKPGKAIYGKHAGSYLSNSPYASGIRPAPAFMDLHSIESVVQNFESPAHATEPVKAHSVAGNLRDSIVTFAYGREWVLVSPTRVTTDSRERLIIADPKRAAVHVLEPKNKNSFRIAGGPQLRLRAPASVAVDKDDRIYVADSERGVVLVFSPDGYYLRTIGLFSGESMFQAPTAIAIDPQLGHLYVIDAPMRQLFILDLSGRLLNRVGGPRDRSGKVRFDNPVDVAVCAGKIVVLDGGSRIHVLGLYGEPLASFPVPNLNDRRHVMKNGLALDSAGNIYLTNPLDSTVEILSPDGSLLGVLGHPGADDVGFNRPFGIWVDRQDRLFVADTDNRRVQMFQVTNPQLSSIQPATNMGKD